MQVVKRGWKEAKADQVPLLAAGVAFYAFLAIFPALIAVVSIVGGMSRYHEASGTPVEDIPISFPIDVSGEAGPDSGNHFSAAVIAGQQDQPLIRRPTLVPRC